MEYSEPPRNAKEPGHETRGAQHGSRIPGQLSRTEAFLYDGARCIDRLFDQVIDRPLRTMAVTACVLALTAVIPH